MMFEHSVKVPRLYKTASKIAKQVSEGKGSIKQLVYEGNHPNIKAVYALVVHVFQRTEDIENLLKKSKLLTKEPRFDPWLAKILITELLWGKKRLTSEAKPIKTILAYEQTFKAHMSDVSSKFTDLKQVEKPRYVRVNTLKTTINEAVEEFRDEGWILKRHSDVKDYTGYLDTVANLSSEEFMIDLHVPNLLIFPPKTQFYQHSAYKNGRIILQDKASCLPAHILNPPPGATVLDMCAAPGMKTTQTAAMIQDKGVIYAVEINMKRYQTLNEIVEASGATCVKTVNRDTLTMTEREFPGVEYILVDPSCSGSGLTDRVEVGQQAKDRDQDRLAKLAGFQIKLLRHALTRFSKAKRVVYSTCSVYPEENEDVVRQVLETCTTFKLVPAGPFVNNAWLNYGSPEFGDIGNYCLYAKPDLDLTSGFFVAVFERLEGGEVNQFLNYNLFSMHKQKDSNKKKKKKKGGGESVEEMEQEVCETENVQKKKKKKKRKDVVQDEEGVGGKKKQKEDSNDQPLVIDVEDVDDVGVEGKRKRKEDVDDNEEEFVNKKKKRRQDDQKVAGFESESKSEEFLNAEDEHGTRKKKKKKKKNETDIKTNDEAVFIDNHESDHKKKKKKKIKHEVNNDEGEEDEINENSKEEKDVKKKKKKKDKKQDKEND